MKTRILLTLLAVLCALGPVRAQQPGPIPPAPVNAPHCTRTTIDLEGVQDNFGGSSEPTTPSPALQAFLAGPGRNP